MARENTLKEGFMSYDYGHPAHRAARSSAMARSGGVCQFCGHRDATEGHHWATVYPKETT